MTCCTAGRTVGLTRDALSLPLLAACETADTSGDASLVCATLMPDHVHWIFTLGARLTVSQVIAKWKIATRAALATADLTWQKNFFEHRLRPEEDVESYAFYVFMNPYAAGLSGVDVAWPWWRKGSGCGFRFEENLRADGAPQPEWLKDPRAHGAGISTGE